MKNKNLDFLKDINRFEKYEYEVIGEIKGDDDNLLLRHKSKNCNNHEFKTTINQFLDGERCPICEPYLVVKNKNENNKIHKNRKTHEQFVKEITNKFGDVYNFLEEYECMSKKIKVQHKCPDGDWYTWDIYPNNLSQGKGLCPKCSGKDRGGENFKRKLSKMHGDAYKYVGEYVQSNEYIIMEHNIEGCHHQFQTTPSGMLNFGVTCPLCTPSVFSKGEDKIEEILTSKNIYHLRQYTFEDCVFKNKLRYDFAIFNGDKMKKEDLTYLIEFQGLQHYSPQTFNGISKEEAEVTFKETIIKDKIKFDYCKNKGIELVIIPYWEFNDIEDILNRKI